MDEQVLQSEDQGTFSAFHEYPWHTDLAFLKGLVALLGGVEKLRPDPAHPELALHARIFYYRKVRHAQVDFTAYKQWVATAAGVASPMPDQQVLSALYWAYGRLAAIQSPPPPNPVHAVAAIARQYSSRSADPVSSVQAGPVWQHSAPRLELYLSRESAPGTAGREDGAAAAPYPAHFAELIAAVRANKPVPGVREIPDTVIRDPSVKPVGRIAAPKKPWETGIGKGSSAYVPQPETGSGPKFPHVEEEFQAGYGS